VQQQPQTGAGTGDDQTDAAATAMMPAIPGTPAVEGGAPR
jgi:hypothetical protein